MPAVEMKVLVAQSQSLQITEPTALQQGHKIFCDKVFFTVRKNATSPSLCLSRVSSSGLRYQVLEAIKYDRQLGGLVFYSHFLFSIPVFTSVRSLSSHHSI